MDKDKDKDASREFLTVEEASAYLGMTPGQVRKLLRQHGLSEFLRASMAKQVLIRKTDLDKVRPATRPAGRRRGVA